MRFRWQEGTQKFYTYRLETIGNAVMQCEFPPKKEALLHEILGRIADKWTLLVIEALDGEGELRFSDLQKRVGGVSQKMLTKTLRQLERDGLVRRRVHAAVPPRVDYRLTRLGESLGLYAIDRIGPLRRAAMREGVAPRAGMPALMQGETDA